MPHHSNFLLASAIAAKENNTILEWTIAYLQRQEKNIGIVEDVKKRNIIRAELIKYPLSKLERINGLQNGETEPETLQFWLKRVNAIEDAIKKNEMPPPIIVTDFWQELGIADGNHRHEALLKQGFTEYWTIFLFTNLESTKKIPD